MFNKLKLMKRLPYLMQDLAVTAYNCNSYRVRHGGCYEAQRSYYSGVYNLDMEEWEALQEKRLSSFLRYATTNSPWYRNYKERSLSEFPILRKSDLIENLDLIATLPESQGRMSMTGGTTGASMKVIYKIDDSQERHAILDSFRERFGYHLGKKTAWFSGKNIADDVDVRKGRCYRDDLINKIRFFSTFHINEKNFAFYWAALGKFSPEFIVGFPSSVYDLCEIAKRKGLKLKSPVKVYFPTAEAVLEKHRSVISEVLGCKVIDQYASSEGAPFILECPEGNLHIHPLTGIFEVVDDDMNPSDEGQLLVTSFTTRGTPLIRYQIGDSIKLSAKDKVCKCGSTFPLVDRIDGRATDYVYSLENGKVNLGNLSNATKDIVGIVCFQIVQDVEDAVMVRVVSLPSFDVNQQANFVTALRERLGTKMLIKIELVDNIPREPSGKFRLVKNNIASKLSS